MLQFTAGSGVRALTQLDTQQWSRLTGALDEMGQSLDFLFFDTAPGISANVLDVVDLADYVVVLASYEPSAVEVIVEAARSKPTGTVLLRGARIITMNGAEVIESGDILIKDNRIEEVGKRGQVKAPSGTRTIDVTGKTIMPGLVDVHAHIWPAWGIHKTQVWE